MHYYSLKYIIGLLFYHNYFYHQVKILFKFLIQVEFEHRLFKGIYLITKNFISYLPMCNYINVTLFNITRQQKFLSVIYLYGYINITLFNIT